MSNNLHMTLGKNEGAIYVLYPQHGCSRGTNEVLITIGKQKKCPFNEK